MYTYTYDANGNVVTRTKDGTSIVDTYTWDDRNRLIEVQETNASTVSWTVKYTYDVNNELIRCVQSDGTGTVTSDQQFAYDGQQIVLAFSGSAHTLTDRMLWGPAVDLLMAQDNGTDLATSGTTNWALGDDQNTIRDWVDSSGDSAGHVTYSAYGQQLTTSAPTADLVFRYSGKYQDQTTGLQYNLNRWYNAENGTWISEDPDGFTALQANLTAYASNSPLDFDDPLGTDDTPDPSLLAGLQVNEIINATNVTIPVGSFALPGSLSGGRAGGTTKVGPIIWLTKLVDNGQDPPDRCYAIKIQTLKFSLAKVQIESGLDAKLLQKVIAHEAKHLAAFQSILDKGSTVMSIVNLYVEKVKSSGDSVSALKLTLDSFMNDWFSKRWAVETARQALHVDFLNDRLGNGTYKDWLNGIANGTIRDDGNVVPYIPSQLTDALAIKNALDNAASQLDDNLGKDLDAAL